MSHIEHMTRNMHTMHTGHITAVSNQKGGVGKTSTAHALISGLTRRGYNTLAIDTDPQGNLTYAMGADENEPGVYELLKGKVTALDIVQHTPLGDIIPGNLLLAGADMEFADTGREYLLSEALDEAERYYEFIIIDSPPQLGILTINVLTAANDLIIPMGADIFSLQGLIQLYATINKVKKRCNPALEIAGLLITRYSGRSILSKELKETIRDRAGQIEANFFETVIREGVAVKEAQVQQTSVFSSSPRSNPAVDYEDFIEEYLKGVLSSA